jgi:hypothetical protein
MSQTCQKATSGRSSRVGVSQISWSPILIDANADRTQKGPDNAGLGRIFRANVREYGNEKTKSFFHRVLSTSELHHAA